MTRMTGRNGRGVGAGADIRDCEFYEWVGFTLACQYYCRVTQKSRSGLVADCAGGGIVEGERSTMVVVVEAAAVLKRHDQK